MANSGSSQITGIPEKCNFRKREGIIWQFRIPTPVTYVIREVVLHYDQPLTNDKIL